MIDVRFSKQAMKFIKKQDKNTQKRLRNAILKKPRKDHRTPSI